LKTSSDKRHKQNPPHIMTMATLIMIKNSVKSKSDSDTNMIMSNPLTIKERPHLRASSISLTFVVDMSLIYRGSAYL
ncbi:MAG: hypothetical protein ACO22R_09395, partial [Chitinophagaceae bacterium]